MAIRISKLILSFVLVSALVLPNFFLLAEEKPNLEEICVLEVIEEKEKELSKKEYEALLKKCEAFYIEQSRQIEKDITKTEAEKKTLQNQIYLFRKKIKNLDYQIYQGNIVVKDLSVQIQDTEGSIQGTSLKIDDSKQKLVAILTAIYKEDEKSLVEIFLSEDTLAGFFNNIAALEMLNSKNQELLEHIKTLKSYLESQKESLDEEKGDRENMLAVQTLQKQESARAKKDQEYYLRLTEAEYQKHLGEKEEVEEKAAEIRARIFELVGVPEAPTFGEALDLARYVESVTRIRPAFLLAIITQESALGRNVGQCYLKNPSTGAGVVAYNSRQVSRVMKPSRDVQPFLSITKELGRDPYATPVSCWMPMYYKGKPYGYGGAMGPAQFIPSTWILYRDKVKAITKKPADPWNIKDAFLASGLLLKENGAAVNEWRAAMRYFSGSSWTKYEERYGNLVVARANCLQTFIDYGTMTTRCDGLVFIPE